MGEKRLAGMEHAKRSKSANGAEAGSMETIEAVDGGTDENGLLEELRVAAMEWIDRNGDGAVDREEVGEALGEFGKTLSGMIAERDADGSGAMEEGEAAGLEGLLAEVLGGSFDRLAFALLDRNRDGRVDGEDVAEILARLEEKSEEEGGWRVDS